MSTPTVSWSEATPIGTDYIRVGDDRIRELKTQIREIITVDHKMDSSGQAATWGHHEQVTLIEAADIGTGAVGVPILGAQTAGGKAELVFTDEDDKDVQLTSAGKLYLPLATDQGPFTGDWSFDELALVEDTAPSTAADEGKLYTKDSGGQPELFFREESDGDEVQLTKGGALKGALSSDQATGSDDISTASTSYVDMTDMSVTISGAGDYLIMFSGNMYGSTTNRGLFVIDIDGTDESNSEGHIVAYTASAQSSVQYLKTLAAGSHTIKIQWKTVSSGTVYQKGAQGKRILTVIRIAS